jgi:transcriptional antiterminator RfaH
MSQLNEEGHIAWYAIHTNPRQEERTWSNLTAWNIEAFAPRVRERRYNQFTGEAQYFSKPLFSRYVFARFNLDRMLHKVRNTRGVHGLVTFNGVATAVDDEIIALIKSRAEKDGFVRIGEDFKHGDPVVVRSGAFKDLAGIFEREMKDSDRVMVLLNTISYRTRVVIDRKSISRLEASGLPPGVLKNSRNQANAEDRPRHEQAHALTACITN